MPCVAYADMTLGAMTWRVDIWQRRAKCKQKQTLKIDDFLDQYCFYLPLWWYPDWEDDTKQDRD